MTVENKDNLLNGALGEGHPLTEGEGDSHMPNENGLDKANTEEDISNSPISHPDESDGEYGDTGEESADLIEGEPKEDASQGGNSDGYYERLIAEDTEAIMREFPELPEDFSITDLKDPMRFGALRDLGLSPVEAYLAVGGRQQPSDNRAHLFSTVPRGAVSRMQDIPRSELKIARDVFSDMSESELQRLYRRVCGR